MSQQQTSSIMLADSNKLDVQILKSMLGNRYQVKTYEAAAGATDHIQQNQPDIVIIDPSMPALDIEDFCHSLKSSNPECYLLFLTSNDSLHDAIEAYELGADEYIKKPFNPVEINAKLEQQIEKKRSHQELIQLNKAASSAAYLAMESSGELGIVIRFMERIGACESYDELGIALIEACESYHVRPIVQIRGHQGSLNFRCANDSIESILLSNSGERGRFIESRGKLIINNHSISILLKNTPSTDDIQYGRIKDNLTVMLNASEARIKSLGLEISVEEQRESGLTETITEAQKSMENVQDFFHDYERNISERMLEFQHHMQNILMTLSLDPEQEETLLESVDEFLQEFKENDNIKNMLEAKFQQLIQMLDQLKLLR